MDRLDPRLGTLRNCGAHFPLSRVLNPALFCNLKAELRDEPATSFLNAPSAPASALRTENTALFSIFSEMNFGFVKRDCEKFPSSDNFNSVTVGNAIISN